ncbi:MAG TPA: VOC family protein [Pyrinomonadaceae bacterium]|jgi:catechol 2,3-dioxygenase-like lactoylglutathione lyase family enzyme
MIKNRLILRVRHAQITIPKGAETEAREFYCRLLGLREIPKPEALRGRGGFWMELDGFQVHIGTEDGFDRRATKAHIAYEVEDLESWREKLLQNNIEILEGVPIPHYNRFEFRDPFGNRVEFLEKTEKLNN